LVYATQGLDLAFVFPVINRDSGLAQDSLTSSTKCSKHLHNFFSPRTILHDEELFVGPLRINECPIDFVSPVRCIDQAQRIIERSLSWTANTSFSDSRLLFHNSSRRMARRAVRRTMRHMFFHLGRSIAMIVSARSQMMSRTIE